MAAPPEDDDDIDHSLADLHLRETEKQNKDKKGKVRQIEWDNTLEELSREKAAADATRGTFATSSWGFV